MSVAFRRIPLSSFQMYNAPLRGWVAGRGTLPLAERVGWSAERGWLVASLASRVVAAGVE